MPTPRTRIPSTLSLSPLSPLRILTAGHTFARRHSHLQPSVLIHELRLVEVIFVMLVSSNMKMRQALASVQAPTSTNWHAQHGLFGAALLIALNIFPPPRVISRYVPINHNLEHRELDDDNS